MSEESRWRAPTCGLLGVPRRTTACRRRLTAAPDARRSADQTRVDLDRYLEERTIRTGG